MGKRYSSEEFDSIFTEVLVLIEKGFTINRSIAHYQISQKTFYSKLSECQRTELYNTSKLNTIYGVGSRGNFKI